ncbi:hypothetical protein N658DRAFT_331833 [Parathielavia hyrcaniae]|uniref:Uncharacterized protein n=1 Tax=Parathielavia hyrcaniae TaxID=113614 RepID=A0AAN6PWW3_9PEZI|nr:hypothetical protein N658DRAFT_331833 [Parathielavia hyrcaniae]
MHFGRSSSISEKTPTRKHLQLLLQRLWRPSPSYPHPLPPQNRARRESRQSSVNKFASSSPTRCRTRTWNLATLPTAEVAALAATRGPGGDFELDESGKCSLHVYNRGHSDRRAASRGLAAVQTHSRHLGSRHTGIAARLRWSSPFEHMRTNRDEACFILFHSCRMGRVDVDLHGRCRHLYMNVPSVRVCRSSLFSTGRTGPEPGMNPYSRLDTGLSFRHPLKNISFAPEVLPVVGPRPSGCGTGTVPCRATDFFATMMRSWTSRLHQIYRFSLGEL